MSKKGTSPSGFLLNKQEHGSFRRDVWWRFDRGWLSCSFTGWYHIKRFKYGPYVYQHIYIYIYLFSKLCLFLYSAFMVFNPVLSKTKRSRSVLFCFSSINSSMKANMMPLKLCSAWWRNQFRNWLRNVGQKTKWWEESFFLMMLGI